MKKYIILSVFVFIMGLFSLNINSVHASPATVDSYGCTAHGKYSTTTGRLCSEDMLASAVQCPPGHLFSQYTGEKCNAWIDDSKIPDTYTEFQKLKIGSRGDAVKTFQEELKFRNLLNGRVDGIYGSITAAAAKKYFIKYPPLAQNKIYVSSPNGGETLVKGTTQTITWWDNTATPSICLPNTGCIKPAPKTYDIKLQATCDSDICTAMYREPILLAKAVSGSSYQWVIPNDLADSAYLIQVCQSGSAICDSSDNAFRITGKAVSSMGTLFISPDGATIKLGTSATFQALLNTCPTGAECFVGPMPVQAMWTLSNPKIATVGYKDSCPSGTYCLVYQPDYLTAIVTGVSKGTTKLIATYKDSNGAVFTSSTQLIVN